MRRIFIEQRVVQLQKAMGGGGYLRCADIAAILLGHQLFVKSRGKIAVTTLSSIRLQDVFDAEVTQMRGWRILFGPCEQ